MEKKTTEYYTKAEVAEILKVHPRTLDAYLRSGKLQGARLGGSWRFTKEDIDKFYESVKAETPEFIKNYVPPAKRKRKANASGTEESTDEQQ